MPKKRSSCRKRISTKRYTERPSPPCAAKMSTCRGLTRKGNDGNLWVSHRSENGQYRWVKKQSTTKRCTTKRSLKKKTQKIKSISARSAAKKKRKSIVKSIPKIRANTRASHPVLPFSASRVPSIPSTPILRRSLNAPSIGSVFTSERRASLKAEEKDGSKRLIEWPMKSEARREIEWPKERQATPHNRHLSQKLKSACQNLGEDYVLGDVPGNGDCQFAAVAYIINWNNTNNLYDVETLRALCAEAVTNMADEEVEVIALEYLVDDGPGTYAYDWVPDNFFSLPTAEKRELIAVNVAKMGNTHWGNHWTLRVMCMILKLELFTVRSSEDNCVYANVGVPNALTYGIMMYTGNHFQPMGVIVGGKPRFRWVDDGSWGTYLTLHLRDALNTQ